MKVLGKDTVLNSRYRIIAPIAEGGFGAVYRAEDQILMRPCAVKENLFQSSAAQVQFKKEASLLAGLNHPALPRVTDRFDANGNQYLVMDYISGHSLQDYLGQIEPKQAVKAILLVADALQYLHSQKPSIFHRDIKPANIIIRHDNHVMLVDFGIARSQDFSEKVQAGTLAVTDGYSPPEQYKGTTDARSDVYALAATLYALIVGRRPEIATERSAGKEVDFSPIPKPLKPILITAMDLAPHRRYTTMQTFISELMPTVKLV